ncbi:rhodanese-like domain-containing protein 11, chloroplastic [Artemisia annua]|uniref:Rhodanese-like domain-containing protein 11, chloroplastic n=1 Tax=Artemisia annua TaxID=35608 RepID=A0A2U1MVQ4_ARTAN|nr:rhodanese-like domain-containing protein 11, chloroplastic [Artemisia annua]
MSENQMMRSSKCMKGWNLVVLKRNSDDEIFKMYESAKREFDHLIPMGTEDLSKVTKKEVEKEKIEEKKQAKEATSGSGVKRAGRRRNLMIYGRIVGSLAACEQLYNAGYRNLFWVQGGLEAAEEEGSYAPIIQMESSKSTHYYSVWYDQRDLVREGPQPIKFVGIDGILEFLGWTDQQELKPRTRAGDID